MLLDSLLNIVAPFDCLGCGLEGELVCKNCLPSIATTKKSSCFLCNRLTLEWRVCPSCSKKTKLRAVAVSSHYEGKVKTLIRQLKYEHTVAAAKPLACLIGRTIPASFKPGVVTWAPAATSRLHQRGYNPAKLIANALAKELNLPVAETLGRHGQSRQVGTTRRKRFTQAENTMYVIRKSKVKSRKLLVVDDVVTTGATINECGRVLKDAGAEAVWGAAAAKH